jgi:hypothetical protein
VIHRTDIRYLNRRMSFQHRWPPPRFVDEGQSRQIGDGESFIPVFRTGTDY